MSEIKTVINRITILSSESPSTKLFIDFEMFYGDVTLAAAATRDKENWGGDIEAAMKRLVNACERELKKEMGKIWDRNDEAPV